jgi:hypothetical protein
MTSEFVFVEPYPTYQAKQGPLGGEIPLLVMSKESNAFSIWQKHFDFVREHHSCTHPEHRLAAQRCAAADALSRAAELER